jgi:hypothetical protein
MGRIFPTSVSTYVCARVPPREVKKIRPKRPTGRLGREQLLKDDDHPDAGHEPGDDGVWNVADVGADSEQPESDLQIRRPLLGVMMTFV